MLNDLARPARLLVAGFGLALGVMLGGPVVGTSSALATGAVVAGIGLEVVVGAVFLGWLGRSDRALRDRVASASAELAAGEVEPVPAVGRVVRRRVVDEGSWLPGRGAVGGRSGLTVLTALGDGPPRRVAALVPLALDLHSRDVPAVLLLHPGTRDAAVLDDRVDPGRLAEIDADPRWRSERLPTDRSVVGGYVALVAALALGLALGVGVSAGLLTLA